MLVAANEKAASPARSQWENYQSSVWTKRARIKYGFTTNGKWSLASASHLTQDGTPNLTSKTGITVPLASLGRHFALAPWSFGASCMNLGPGPEPASLNPATPKMSHVLGYSSGSCLLDVCLSTELVVSGSPPNYRWDAARLHHGPAG